MRDKVKPKQSRLSGAVTAMALLGLFQFLPSQLVADPGFHGTGGQYNLQVPINQRIGFDQHPGTRVPAGITLTDEHGVRVELGSYFGKKPIVLALVYYRCPNLCTLALNGLFKAMQGVPFTAGHDYSVVLVSINPAETARLAAEKKRHYLRAYRRAGAAVGIHFLTGNQDAIDALARSVGFRYFYDAQHHQYAHPSGLTVLTPEGKVSRYLFGVDYARQSLRLALVEASRNRIGSPVDAFLLCCYRYDSVAGTYTFLVQRALSIAAAITVAFVGGGIGLLLRLERRETKEAKV